MNSAIQGANGMSDVIETVKPVPTLITRVQNLARGTRRAFIAIFRHLLHPNALHLSETQAEYVEGLFMSGSTPEAIGRAVNTMYGRERFKALRIWDAEQNRFVFKDADFEMDGMEYVWAAMKRIGALKHRIDGWYYITSHPMVKKLAGIAAAAPVPQSLKKGAE